MGARTAGVAGGGREDIKFERLISEGAELHPTAEKSGGKRRTG